MSDSDSASEYRPQTPTQSLDGYSNVETSPSERVRSGTKMSDEAKRRVDRATSGLTAKRCLIENTDESNHVDYAHCLPRSTKGALLDRLEHAWKMDRFTLNVDTRYNVFRLSPKFHKAFDAGTWLLLPETQILTQYYDAIDTNVFPDINDEFYKYTLIAKPKMSKIPIHREKSPTSNPTSPSAADFTYYQYPYRNFPLITSHVHPRFIICNAGPKLVDILPLLREYRDRADDIAMVHAIWQSWNRAILPKIFAETKFRDDDPSIKDSDSQHTAHRRVLRSTLPKRKAPREHPSPTPMSSKQQKLADGVWLDDETLHEFQQQITSDNPANLKKQSILSWLNGVSYLESEIGVNKFNVLDFIMDTDSDLGVERT